MVHPCSQLKFDRMSKKFPRALRLRAPDDFKKIWKTGKRLSVHLIAMVVCKNNLGYPRLGVSISKKNVHSAVARNRVKRLARETFRIRQDKLGSADIVIVGYKGIDELMPKEQYQRFNALWDVYTKQFIKPLSA